jgi:hypothetical protein
MARAPQDHLASNPQAGDQEFDDLTKHLLPWARASLREQQEAKKELAARKKKERRTGHTRQGITVGA